LNSQDVDAFRAALNTACGEINEAARLSEKLFEGEDLKLIRRELARLMEIIDAKILTRL
jgi:hypothetical protein